MILAHDSAMSSHDSDHGEDSHDGAYQEFLATREEILKYKWIASEQAGHDIGFEAGLLGWHAQQRARQCEAGEKSGGRKGA